MKNKEIAKEINIDIEFGVYERFPKLKDRLSHIAHKLVLSTYIKDRKLSVGEENTLRENNYITLNSDLD